MSSEVSINVINKKKLLRKKKTKPCKEDLEAVVILENLKSELDTLYNKLNYVTEPILIDSCIYEIKSIHMKYQYYLNLCKEHRLVSKVL